MDSYEILGVSSDSGDKEIEIAYKDLVSKYDPRFNTSKNAYEKYRKIIKAYESIKDEKRRKMYSLKSDVSKQRVSKEYKLYDYSNSIDSVDEIDYKNVVVDEDVKISDVIINKDISYLYYLLNLKCEIEYSYFKKCNECKEYVTCSACDGYKVVYSDEKLITCPVCNGVGKISKECDVCHGLGKYLANNKISFCISEDKHVFKDLGNEYYDKRSNLIVNFNFFDKDEIRVKDNIIEVNYHVSSEEIRNGVHKLFYGENDSFSLDEDEFINNQKEIHFRDKIIRFIFEFSKYDGRDIKYYLVANEGYKNAPVYFNSDYSLVSEIKNETFVNEVTLNNSSFVFNGKGEKGRFNGNDGNAIVEVFFNNSKGLVYSSNITILETSKLFNLLGGKISTFAHCGFKPKNALVNKDGKYYLLKGNLNSKMKLKEYFVIKVAMIVLWLLLPLIALIVPYSKEMFIAFIIAMLSSLLLFNALMEVKI